MKKELLKGLTPEQVKKVEACKSSEEILKLAKEEGVQLNDEQLDAVSGGACGGQNQFNAPQAKVCPICGSEHITVSSHDSNYDTYRCEACQHVWMENKR